MIKDLLELQLFSYLVLPRVCPNPQYVHLQKGDHTGFFLQVVKTWKTLRYINVRGSNCKVLYCISIGVFISNKMTDGP